MVKKMLIGLSSLVGALVLFVGVVSAAPLENAYVSLSNPLSVGSASYTFYVEVVNDDLGSFTFQFCTTPSGSCTTPSNLNINSVSEGTISSNGGDSGTEWVIYDDNTNIVTADRTSADTGVSGNNYSFQITTITNPAFNDCDNAANGSTTTCYVRVKSYTDTSAGTEADSTVVTFTITRAVTVTATVDPSFTMIISGMDPAETANANTVALTATSTITTIPFGNLTPGSPVYAGQSATVSTNAAGGYTITARMSNNMTGQAYLDDIDAFAGAGVATNDAIAWTSPTGTTSGTNTGWLGVGTDDTDVAGFEAAGFFPLGTTAQTIASQSTSASSEIDIFAYAIEVNAYQQADSYTGTLRYNALPTF